MAAMENTKYNIGDPNYGMQFHKPIEKSLVIKKKSEIKF